MLQLAVTLFGLCLSGILPLVEVAMFLLAVTVTELLLGLFWVGVVLGNCLLLKIESRGFFLSGIHPLGATCWAMAGSAIELLLRLLMGKLVLVFLVLLL